MGDTGIPPKQILEQVIEGIPLFMGNKYTERNRFICSFFLHRILSKEGNISCKSLGISINKGRKTREMLLYGFF